ncbi:MAG: PP2C family protein-serine/threonine phosphatase [Acidimicrobiales bacterium]
MTRLELGPALRAAQGVDPSSIADVLLGVARDLDATDVVAYLADFAHQTLEPIPDRRTHLEVPTSEPVASSMAGRAFTDHQPVHAERDGSVRVWVPIIEGSDRTGVLALTVPAVDDATLGACEELGLLAGYLVATQARFTDLYNLYRRREALSLAASMQWDLLPPLVLKSERVTVAGLVEPAYDVGGDCFDYALNDTAFDVAVMDAVGHGVGSALIAALGIGSYRHDRREARSLEQIHTNLDAAMAAHFSNGAFVTGQLARLDLESGQLRWTNAGHPLPLLIRSGQVVGELDCPPTVPWGMGAVSRTPAITVAEEVLEPGDAVLFYTDGVVEAHQPGGELFGVERLVDLVGQQASSELAPEEVVRRLARAVVEHQSEQLDDDATLVLVQWHGGDR